MLLLCIYSLVHVLIQQVLIVCNILDTVLGGRGMTLNEICKSVH
jgi:hypothetical protein